MKHFFTCNYCLFQCSSPVVSTMFSTHIQFPISKWIFKLYFCNIGIIKCFANFYFYSVKHKNIRYTICALRTLTFNYDRWKSGVILVFLFSILNVLFQQDVSSDSLPLSVSVFLLFVSLSLCLSLCTYVCMHVCVCIIQHLPCT